MVWEVQTKVNEDQRWTQTPFDRVGGRSSTNELDEPFRVVDDRYQVDWTNPVASNWRVFLRSKFLGGNHNGVCRRRPTGGAPEPRSPGRRFGVEHRPDPVVMGLSWLHAVDPGAGHRVD